METYFYTSGFFPRQPLTRKRKREERSDGKREKSVEGMEEADKGEV